MNLPPGTLLQGGRYRIDGVLGQGGFGITYRAEQVMLGRAVAIKEFFMKDFNLRDGNTGIVSTPSTSSSKQVEQYRIKFVKEARNLATLKHPHIIQVVDIFEDNGKVYYVMPYYAGGSLSDRVKANGPLDEQTAMQMIRPIAAALRYMHSEKRLCHYDVKPANILLDDKGLPVLIDFGISKNYDVGGNETSSTPIGMSEGYAPIEQYQGQVQEFSPESDVYALGATLYYLLTGKKPPTAIDRVSGATFEFPSTCPTTIRRLVESSMIISRQHRPKTTGIFLQEMSFATQTPVVQPKPADEDVTVIAPAPASEPDEEIVPASDLSSESAKAADSMDAKSFKGELLRRLFIILGIAAFLLLYSLIFKDSELPYPFFVDNSLFYDGMALWLLTFGMIGLVLGLIGNLINNAHLYSADLNRKWFLLMSDGGYIITAGVFLYAVIASVVNINRIWLELGDGYGEFHIGDLLLDAVLVAVPGLLLVMARKMIFKNNAEENKDKYYGYIIIATILTGVAAVLLSYKATMVSIIASIFDTLYYSSF